MNDFYDLCCIGDLDRIISEMNTGINFNLNTALYCACTNGNFEVVKLLIDKGADDYDEALSRVFNGLDNINIEIVKLLIEKGAKCNWLMKIACSIGNNELVNLLIDKNIYNVNSALFYACEERKIEIIKSLIKKGANDWNKGLYCANLYLNIRIIKLMINNGATNVNEFICYSNKYDKNKIIKLLNYGLIFNKLINIKNYNKLIEVIKKKETLLKNKLNNYIVTDLSKLISKFYL